MAQENLTQHTLVGPAAGGHGQAAFLVSYHCQPYLYSPSLCCFSLFPVLCLCLFSFSLCPLLSFYPVLQVVLVETPPASYRLSRAPLSISNFDRTLDVHPTRSVSVLLSAREAQPPLISWTALVPPLSSGLSGFRPSLTRGCTLAAALSYPVLLSSFTLYSHSFMVLFILCSLRPSGRLLAVHVFNL